MFISNLKVINTDDDFVLQDIPFHSGVNFVVDTDESDQHNKVGKTTFLKLIDVALGAQDRDYIYFDSETNSTETGLQNYIHNNKSAVVLTVVDNLSKPRKTVELHVELYKRGRYMINGEKVNQQDYRKQLNTIFFHNREKSPSFRQLINSFVRISMSGDTSAFLKNLPRAGYSDYRAVYNFLFDISDPNIDKRRGELNRKLKTVKDAEKQYKRVQRAPEPTEIAQIITALNNEKAELQEQLNDIVSSEDFQKNRNHIARTRKKYSELTNEIGNLQYRLQRNMDLINSTKEDAKNAIDDNLTRRFFDEVNSIIPNLNKSFEELVQFNQKLYQNKLKYLEELHQDISRKITQLDKERNDLVQGNQTLISLVANDRLEEYTELASQIAQREQEISSQKQLLESLQMFESEKDSIQQALDNLEKNDHKDGGSVYQAKMSLFNKYFTSFSQQINGERPVLTYNPDNDKFPLAISQLAGSSTGTRKSLIAAYDLAYQKFAEEGKKSVPNFIIHDVLENIEGNNLKTTINIANEIGVQYVVAILKEKLDSSGITEDDQEKLKVIRLSTDHRIFDDPRQQPNNIFPFEACIDSQRGRKLKDDDWVGVRDNVSVK